jgi:hypothetical protein
MNDELLITDHSSLIHEAGYIKSKIINLKFQYGHFKFSEAR